LNDVAAALDKMTDSGRFELLATAVLRRARPELAAIIHTGVNAGGKPIPSPIDGIGLLARTSPHFGSLQHTTCSQEELRRKWLGREGDIAKAAALIGDERQRNPSAKLTLVLTTNRVPDETLFRDAQAKAREALIELDIWERTRLADFLEHDPDGQWLARQYLNIPQRRLSTDLLADVCQRNADAFTKTLLDDPGAWIERALDRQLVEAVNRQTVTFLSWPSGTGKTTAASRLLQRWLANGGLGLWIPSRIFEQTLNLENAIDVVLRSYEPALEANAGAAAVALCSAASPFLLVVDDVSRSMRPTSLLEQLVQLSTIPDQTAPVNGRKELSAFRLVCPVWPQIVQQTSEAAKARIQLFAIAGGTFDRIEATTAVSARAKCRGVTLTDLQTSQVASALGNDPLLIAVASIDDVAVRTAIKVIADFVSAEALRCAATQDGPIEADYVAALDQLAFEMISRRQLEPTWASISDWFATSASALECLRRLVKQRAICHVLADGQFSFRHDRVRTVILATCIQRRLDKSLPEEIVGDPYFAEVIGVSLTLDPPSIGAVKQVGTLNPLALFHALNVALPGSEVFQAIISGIRSWFDRGDAEARKHRSLRWAMQLSLAEIDATEVLEVASLFRESTWALEAARFRNGDVQAGANYCYSFGPGYRVPDRDRLIEHARMRFGSDLVNGLSVLLQDGRSSQRLRIGALHLAGFLGRSELATAIRAAWDSSRDQTSELPAFVWAGGRCCGGTPAEVLDAPLDLWASLPADRDKKPSGSHDQSIVEDAGLQWGFIGRMSVPTLEYLITRAREPRLAWPIAILLQWIDHPDAAEFVARHKAAVSREVESTGGISLWLERNPRWFQVVPHPYTDLSRDRLKTLWGDARNDSHLRRRAFQLWCRDASERDLGTLRQLHVESPLGDDALRTRLELSDPTARAPFREKIRTSKHPSYWWQFLRKAWLDDYEPDLRAELDRRGSDVKRTWEESGSGNDWTLAELIMELDEPRAEDLIVRNWDHLKYAGIFVQAALFVGTARCQSLVATAVQECPEPKRLFMFIGSHWQMGGRAQIGRLTATRLSAVQPYLDLLDESSMHSLWEGCNQDGFFDWRRRHIDQRLSDTWRGRSGIGDEDLFAWLDRIAEHPGHVWPDYWVEEFQHRGDARERPLHVVEAWLKARGTLRVLEVAAACVSLSARRSELRVLDQTVAGDEETAIAIREDARFAVFTRTPV
jgi:hypothetical protein